MKLTAVRMELRELKRRMPAHRAQASTAGSSTKFRGPAKERMPLARNFSGLDTVQEAEDRKRRQRGLPKSKSAAALQAQQEAQHSRSVPAKAEERTPDAFADFLKEGTRDAEKKYMAKRYLYDGAVETWKKQANFESYVFKEWLSSQTGDDLSELTTMFSNSMWESKKKKENEDSSRTLADRGRQVLGGMGRGHSEESPDGPDGGGRQAKAKKSEAQIRATFAADAHAVDFSHMQDRFHRVKK